MDNNKSQLKIGIILNYINLIVGNIIPIFYVPIMLRFLGQDEYAIYKLSSSIVSYLGLLSAGIGSAITRYLIEANQKIGKEEEEKYLGLFMVIFQIIAILSFIVGVVLTFNLNIFYGESLSNESLERMKIIVFLMVCNTALSFQLSPYVAVVSAHEKFIFLQCMNLLSTSIVPLLNLFALFLGYASIGMAIISLAVGIITRFIYLIYVRKSLEIKARYKNLPIYRLKEILVFSFWVFVANIVNQLYNATDTVMIGMIPALATAGVAIYNVGSTFSNLAFSFASGITVLLAPRVNKVVFAGASNDELTEMAIRVGRVQGYLINLIVSGFISFGMPFIFYYAGEEYYQAYWIAIIMMIPNTIPLLQTVCLNIVVAQNKHKFRSFVYLIIAVINVVGSWFLLNTDLGIIGAALVTGVGLILGPGIAMNWYYKNKTGLFMGRFWKSVLKIYIIPLIMCPATLILSRWINFYSIPIFLIGIIVYTIIYFVSSWFLIMNEYEKNLFLSPFKKIIKKK